MQSGIQNSLMQLFGNNRALFLLFIVWVVLWKGFALWKSARKNQKYWFVAILIFNTAGILEILYLFVLKDIKFSKKFPWFTRATIKKDPVNKDN